MTQYIAADALAGSAPTPSVSLTGANPFLALWMLPITLTQTWMSAWARSDFAAAPYRAETLDADSGETPTDQNDQIPVPAPLQDDRDGPVYA